jgi:GNAT superfamily N-acetyltransferase
VASISVRLAESQHLAEIPKIELAAATLFSEADLPESIRYKVTGRSDLQEGLGHERLWVALHEGTPVGFALASVVDGVGYLDELSVRPEFGRQGVGTTLVSTVVDWARTEDFPCLTLVTFRHLAWNAPFYEKLGFRGLDSSEHGTELAGLIEEERLIGINIADRVAMRLDL